MITQAQHLATLSRDFPTAWRLCDEYRASRGRNGVHNWPPQYFLPSVVWGKIALESSKPCEIDWKNLSKFIELAAYGAWRPAQSIYQFAPALYDAITDTPIDGRTIPVEVLLHLPEWCMYIETPRLTYCGKQFDGFFALMNYNVNSDKVELCFLLWNNFGTSFFLPLSRQAMPARSLELSRQTALARSHEARPLKRPTLREALSSNLQRAKDSAASLGVSPQVQQDLDGITFDEPAILKMLNLVLYLCSTNLELNSARGETSPRILPSPQRNKTGFRLYPPDAPTIWHVGKNLSRQLVETQKQAPTEYAEHRIHNSPRPHVRRAHWHGFWSGPRKPFERSNKNARKFAVKWLPPIPVALGNNGKDENDSVPGSCSI